MGEGPVKKIKPYWVVAALLAVFVFANMIVTNRPLSGYKMMQVEEIATLPDTPELADVRLYAQNRPYGFIPHMRGSGAAPAGTPPLKVGWVYEERGIMGLPYWASVISTGPSLYFDTGTGYQLAGVAPGQVALLEQKAGSPVLTGYKFSGWRYMWGWLFPLTLLLLAWLWLRERRAAEDAHWAYDEPTAEP